MTAVLDGQGRDVLDAGVDVRRGHADELRIVVSTESTELAGSIVVPSGLDVGGLCVLAFPLETALWAPRRILSTQVDTERRYSLKGLPVGEYLLAVLTRCDQEEFVLSGFLEQLVPHAARVSVTKGVTTHDLQLKSR